MADKLGTYRAKRDTDRLEIDGVLVSWAVPKGPSTDPSEKISGAYATTQTESVLTGRRNEDL